MIKEAKERIVSVNGTLLTAGLKIRPLNYEAVGAENIIKVRELLTENKIIVAAIDHKSYADLVSGLSIIIKKGIDDLLPRLTVIVAGKYLDQFQTRVILRMMGALGINMLPVVTHTMKDDPRRQIMTPQAIRTAQEETKDGSILVIAPEGTRAREPIMQPARYGAVRFWHGQGERYILPIAIEGTEKQWPRGVKGIPYYLAWGQFFKKAKVIFGEPISVEAIDSIAKAYACNDPEDLEKLMVDVVMLQIARLHIEHGDKKYAEGYYQDLLDKLNRHPLSQALRRLGYLDQD